MYALIIVIAMKQVGGTSIAVTSQIIGGFNGGWDSFGAFVSHLKFVADHHLHIKRVAAVTGSGFLKTVPIIAEHFVQAKTRHFDLRKGASGCAARTDR